MKSPEQMFGPPHEQSEKPERKLTTPEEAAKMTRQRRINFGLPAESPILTPEQTEGLENSISGLMTLLESYDLEQLNPETEQWAYEALQEGYSGLDRELALANLQEIIQLVEDELSKKQNNT